MAEPGRTEKATPKRRQDAREKGQVFRSTELNSVIVLLGAFLTIRFMGPYIVDSFNRIAVFSFENLNIDFGLETMHYYVLFYLLQIFKIITPLLVVVLLFSLVANYFQIGVLFTLQPLMPKLSNINPITGLQKFFSRRSLFDFSKSIIKLIVIGWLGYLGIKDALPELVPTMQMQSGAAVHYVGSLASEILDKIILVLFLLSIMDFIYQKWEYEENLKMTKQEIRDEFKESEGDPMIKVRIRQLQKEMARRRMFDNIPDADVIITNPTHIAVALKYKEGMQAPTVIAKGERMVAERIKEIGKLHDIPMVENVVVARALYKQCMIGSLIPAELFEAVAEILAFVYRMNKKKTKTLEPV